MVELNPYDSPESSSDPPPATTPASTAIMRSVEYAIAILIVVALIWVVQAFVIRDRFGI